MDSFEKFNLYKIDAVVWLYPGMAGWHFLTVPEDVAEDINRQFGDMKAGWGSLPVKAIIGKTTWDTSIFPDKKSKGYLLPLKKEVRKSEKISVDQMVSVVLEIKI